MDGPRSELSITPGGEGDRGPDSPPEAISPGDWSRQLSDALARPVRVTYGRARRHVLVARDEGHVLEVRMNAGFARAPRSVREATAAWLRAGKRARRACVELDAWIVTLQQDFERNPRKRPRLRDRGAQHDLRELADEILAGDLAADSFPLGEPPAVTWGRRGRARRQLQLGSFDPEHNLVRMHPVLDQPGVPRSFVRYVLFHELLHAVMPTPRSQGGRAVHHSPAFRRRERAYPGYEEALQWQARRLQALLRSSRSGKPMSVESGKQRAPRPSGRALRSLQRWLFPELDL